MKKVENQFLKPIILYLLVLALSLTYQIYDIKPISFIITILMLAVPMKYLQTIPVKINIHHILISLCACIVTLAPYCIVTITFLSGIFIVPPINYSLFQLFGTAIPEELFFRAYLQENLGQNKISILIVSLMFSLCHFGLFYVTGNIEHLFVFLPSLIMGWLYFKTKNILPSIIYHYLANMVYACVY
ncbi:abortive infection protein [Candidatus Magnetoovum chiemensis]|nr:abortive infection protein [Candidatus Magnetoovum chiemensis]